MLVLFFSPPSFSRRPKLVCCMLLEIHILISLSCAPSLFCCFRKKEGSTSRSLCVCASVAEQRASHHVIQPASQPFCFRSFHLCGGPREEKKEEEKEEVLQNFQFFPARSGRPDPPVRQFPQSILLRRTTSLCSVCAEHARWTLETATKPPDNAMELYMFAFFPWLFLIAYLLFVFIDV